MKKQKLKKFFKKNIVISFLSFFSFWVVFWAWFTSIFIEAQQSTGLWSTNSVISFTWSESPTTWNEWYYVNLGDNSSIIWNYFEWFYYDSVFWLFQLDWSNDTNENVRIVDSTSNCWTGYGYKLWWRAYSGKAGYIDFDYNSSTYVYYCEDDNRLHWTAYSQYVWYQNFEWIEVQVIPNIASLVTELWSEIFVNDYTNIGDSTSSWSLGWDTINLDDTKESIFYIIK